MGSIHLLDQDHGLVDGPINRWTCGTIKWYLVRPTDLMQFDIRRFLNKLIEDVHKY